VDSLSGGLLAIFSEGRSHDESIVLMFAVDMVHLKRSFGIFTSAEVSENFHLGRGEIHSVFPSL
jgi:hypothetical protein